MADPKKYLDLSGLGHYDDKLKTHVSGQITSALDTIAPTIDGKVSSVSVKSSKIVYTNIVSGTSTDHDVVSIDGTTGGTSGSSDIITSGAVYSGLSGKEDTSNKTTSLTSSSTDVQYPSAKVVYDALQNVSGNVDDVQVDGVSVVTNKVANIVGKADVATTVTSVAYDTTNKKITETINSTTTDVVSAETLMADMADATTSSRGIMTAAQATELSGLQGNIDAIYKAASAPSTPESGVLVQKIGSEATARAAADTTLQTHIDEIYKNDSGTESGVLITKLSGKADAATTLAGYGITDAKIENNTITLGSSTITPLTTHQDISGKADKATTLSGYGITDAKIESGIITLGTDTITPITSHQDISGKADKSTTLAGYGITDANITDGVITLGGNTITPITSHQDISGKADKATTLAGYGITDAKIESGVITLGASTITPITSHQDISGKQDASTAVTHAASTAVGSATHPVYVAANGSAMETTYELNKTVPSDAVFTDTTYTFAEGSVDGSFSVTPAGGSAQSVAIHGLGDAAYKTTENDCLATTAGSVLDARQGKVLNDRIEALEGIGRFLSTWNMTTGLPGDNPAVSPYTYKTGDYYIVNTVPSTGDKLKPTGSSYTADVPSTVAETGTVDLGDFYFYTTTGWQLVHKPGGTGSVTFSQILGQPSDNTNLASALGGKVDKVTGKSLILDTEVTRLAGMSDGANKVETSTTNGNIKIDGTESTVYTHPTTDGNLHVPATGTGNNGKFLMAGSTAGSLSWGTPTDTKATVTVTGTGNAITNITASDGALTATKGATYLTSNDISGKADKATTLAGYGITDAKIASGVITLGSNTITPLTSHQDISGKADKASITAGTAGTSSATSGSTLAVPYVTMNAQGIVTGYGTHTHTVTGFLTQHQDISGKQDASTAVTHTASTAVGSTTQPVYIASNGTATAIGYTIAKSVPSDAVFTDTTYESKAAASGGTEVSLVTTGEKYTWNSKADAFTVTNGGPTLSWGTTSTVGTVKGTDLKVTMPANPNTDHCVESTASTGNGNYPIHLNNGTSATTNTVLMSTNVYANPSTGTIGATKVNVAGGCTLQYDSTANCLNFVFA